MRTDKKGAVIQRRTEITIKELQAYLTTLLNEEEAILNQGNQANEQEAWIIQETKGAYRAYRYLKQSLGQYQAGKDHIRKAIENYEKEHQEKQQQIDDFITDLLPGTDSRGSKGTGPKPGLLYPSFPNGEHGQANTCTRPKNDRPRPTEKGEAEKRKSGTYQIKLFMGGEVLTLAGAMERQKADDLFTLAKEKLKPKAKGEKMPPYVLFLINRRANQIISSATNAAFK